jgi:hypothetical protein
VNAGWFALFCVGVLRARAKHFLNRRSGVSAERRTLKSLKSFAAVCRRAATAIAKSQRGFIIQPKVGAARAKPFLNRRSGVSAERRTLKSLKSFAAVCRRAATAIAKSQRGFIIQPKVGAVRLPWDSVKRNQNPERVLAHAPGFNSFRVDEIWEREPSVAVPRQYSSDRQRRAE